jgi:hypothetical protein
LNSTLPIITFDTSAHNRLVDDGAASERIMAALGSGFHFRFAGLSIEEMVATPDHGKRAALFASCERIRKDGRTDCVQPHNELIRLLILAHSKNPASFDWKAVGARAFAYEEGIGQRELIGDEQLSANQRREQFTRSKQYEKMFSGPRAEIERVFSEHGEAPPVTFREAILRLQGSNGSLIWGMGGLLYERVSGTNADESTVKDFMDRCPPFRALIYALLLSWYDRGVRDRRTGEKFTSGRNDLFMAVYLPYCNQFVTAEIHGEQERCLREVAAVANLQTRVLSYDDFCKSLLAAV